MELKDFCHYFNMVSICCENPNFIDGDLTCQWQCMVYDGSWVSGSTAGGSYSNCEFIFLTFTCNNKKKTSVEPKETKKHNSHLHFSCSSLPAATFSTNPQYRIQVKIINKEEKEDKNILLSLMQKPQQGEKRKERRSHPIGLSVVKVYIQTWY